MSTYEATFEIESKSDAYAVREILENTYNTIREESRTVREDSADADALLASFETLKDASHEHGPGTLTITYETEDGGFED